MRNLSTVIKSIIKNQMEKSRTENYTIWNKNSSDELYSRLETREERTMKLEIIQFEEQRIEYIFKVQLLVEWH